MYWLKILLDLIRGTRWPTRNERRRMEESGLNTKAEQQAWLLGYRRRGAPKDPTTEEQRAFLMGSLRVRGGIGR